MGRQSRHVPPGGRKGYHDRKEKGGQAIAAVCGTHCTNEAAYLLQKLVRGLLGSNNIAAGNPYLVPKTWPDPNTEIWVFCRTKLRATYFTSFLYRYGYKNVYLVDGGIAGWAEKGYPLFSKDFGEIKVLKYNKELAEEYEARQF